jgi:hypothetical protein
MCGGKCGCDSSFDEEGLFEKPAKPRINPATLEEDSKVSFNAGYAEGFRHAREVFWEEFQIKASDAKMVAKYLSEEDPSALEVDGLRIVAATYLHAADVIIRDRREYPGYIEKDEKLF